MAPQLIPLTPSSGAKEEWVFGHQFTGDCFRLPGVYDAANHPMPTDVSIFSEGVEPDSSAGNVVTELPDNPDPSVPPGGAAEYYVKCAVFECTQWACGNLYNIIGWLV